MSPYMFRCGVKTGSRISQEDEPLIDFPAIKRSSIESSLISLEREVVVSMVYCLMMLY